MRSCWRNIQFVMPKLYEYFGLIVMFYANEHEPIHVHGRLQGCECRAELIVPDAFDFKQHHAALFALETVEE